MTSNVEYTACYLALGYANAFIVFDHLQKAWTVLSGLHNYLCSMYKCISSSAFDDKLATVLHKWRIISWCALTALIHVHSHPDESWTRFNTYLTPEKYLQWFKLTHLKHNKGRNIDKCNASDLYNHVVNREGATQVPNESLSTRMCHFRLYTVFFFLSFF